MVKGHFAAKIPSPISLATVLWVCINRATSPLLSGKMLQTKLNPLLGVEHVTQDQPTSTFYTPVHSACFWNKINRNEIL